MKREIYLKPSKKDKIIWAVNPAQKPSEAKALVKELKIWAKKLDCDVQPVAVFSKLYLDFPTQMNKQWNKSYEDLARESTITYLKKLPTSGFLKPQLLHVNSLSNRRLASELVQFSEKNDAVLLFANTRVKKTWNPFRLGGFAETLITTSKTPVLLMHPDSVSKPQKKSILFPTNFSTESNKALAHIEPWAVAFDSKILLFNQVEIPNSYSHELGIDLKMKKIMHDAEIARTKKLNIWSAHLAKQEVKSEVIVKKQRKYVGAEIIDIAKKNKVELIVLASRTGPLAQALLGSVARDIIVQARCPVLIFHHAPAHVNSKILAASPSHNLNHQEQTILL